MVSKAHGGRHSRLCYIYFRRFMSRVIMGFSEARSSNLLAQSLAGVSILIVEAPHPLNSQVPLAWPPYYSAYNPISNYQHILEKKVVKVCRIRWHNLQIHANFVGMNHREVNLTLCMRYAECWTRRQKVFEVNGIQDDSFIAFGDRKPASRYHFQVIPKRHIGVWRIMAPDKLFHAAI